jgi:hypothetical protein
MIFVACGGRAAPLSPVEESASASGSASGVATSGSGDSDSGALSAPASGAESSSGTTEADAATSDAAVLDASGDAALSVDAGPFAVKPSPGCYPPQQALPGPTHMWIRQPPNCDEDAQANCQAIPPGSAPPANPMAGDPEWRGWWVWIPPSYDPMKPTRVIYSFAGYGDQDIFNAGNSGFNFDVSAYANAILVGLNYDTFTSDYPLSYDGRDPISNDLEFFPWLQNRIERELCVDMSHEYMTGNQTGEWVVQQLNCKFPTRLRASIGLAGCEPGTPANPGGSLPTCVSNGPQATFFVHNTVDTVAPYACILPGCTRMLKQNGCAVTDCSDPTDPNVTSPYTLPSGVVFLERAVCRQFNGCPADYPVVFCTATYPPIQQVEDDLPLVGWDWFANRLR